MGETRVEDEEGEYDDRFAIAYGDDYVDVTDRVLCYEKGKTFDCDCGQGFGAKFNMQAKKCPRCGRYCVDKDWESRGPPEREEQQTAISNWT